LKGRPLGGVSERAGLLRQKSAVARDAGVVDDQRYVLALRCDGGNIGFFHGVGHPCTVKPTPPQDT
jgi:hypothetical protein